MVAKFEELTDIPALLAPMVGLSHVAFRKTLSEYISPETNALWATEMLNSRRLPNQRVGETNETLSYENEHNLYPQVLGNDDDYIRQSISILENWGARAIDINMGCPVRKALQHNYGVSLMGDIDYAARIVKVASQSATVPVSVKLRAGHQKDEKYLLNFCQALIDNGASWLTLHPRLASEQRKGKADWSQIKLLKENFEVPIIGNGDIQCLEDIEKMLEETNCDAVMIGRALTAKPWLLSYVSNQFCHTKFPIPSDKHDEAKAYGKFLIRFIENCFEFYSEKDALKRIRFMVSVGHVWLNFGHSLLKIVHKKSSYNELVDTISKYFENDSLRICDRTNLRY
jgi:tRNA-dihydrouridine synthase B